MYVERWKTQFVWFKAIFSLLANDDVNWRLQAYVMEFLQCFSHTSQMHTTPFSLRKCLSKTLLWIIIEIMADTTKFLWTLKIFRRNRKIYSDLYHVKKVKYRFLCCAIDGFVLNSDNFASDYFQIFRKKLLWIAMTLQKCYW